MITEIFLTIVAVAIFWYLIEKMATDRKISHVLFCFLAALGLIIVYHLVT